MALSSAPTIQPERGTIDEKQNRVGMIGKQGRARQNLFRPQASNIWLQWSKQLTPDVLPPNMIPTFEQIGIFENKVGAEPASKNCH